MTSATRREAGAASLAEPLRIWRSFVTAALALAVVLSLLAVRSVARQALSWARWGRLSAAYQGPGIRAMSALLAWRADQGGSSRTGRVVTTPAPIPHARAGIGATIADPAIRRKSMGGTG